MVPRRVTFPVCIKSSDPCVFFALGAPGVKRLRSEYPAAPRGWWPPHRGACLSTGEILQADLEVARLRGPRPSESGVSTCGSSAGRSEKQAPRPPPPRSSWRAGDSLARPAGRPVGSCHPHPLLSYCLSRFYTDLSLLPQ